MCRGGRTWFSSNRALFIEEKGPNGSCHSKGDVCIGEQRTVENHTFQFKPSRE